MPLTTWKNPDQLSCRVCKSFEQLGERDPSGLRGEQGELGWWEEAHGQRPCADSGLSRGRCRGGSVAKIAWLWLGLQKE
jgi:hypothetical protein